MKLEQKKLLFLLCNNNRSINRNALMVIPKNNEYNYYNTYNPVFSVIVITTS